MLRNTLILPESDARLAARKLDDAIDALDVILMLVFGKGAQAEQIVEWADGLCEKTRTAGGSTVRRVVWIRKPESASIQKVLRRVIDGDLPLVAVLNFHDELKGTMNSGDPIRPLTLERLFLRGGETD